ncbi:alpha-L-rhamnosidase [Caloramator sp. E03]|uniref:alpha-L-rhamnosidase n=1 Tax=Caloramator sp. E03 TaxID=2576307 RepID=UPI0011105397|nr:alpha-L-rhamnosidase [Caloramator sp. E03]QCX34299.1 alpha-L-rhamnosidase [Caloramator sp. E03]
MALFIKEVRCEYLINPIGISTLKPRFSWIIDSDRNGTKQTAYQIVFSKDETFSSIFYDTGKINSYNSVHVEYNGPKLCEQQRYYYRIRIWDNYGNISDYSDINFFEVGIIDNNRWIADWIAVEDKDNNPMCPYFRKEFTLQKDIKKAVIYVSALGLYELFLNGKRVGDYYFTPGWTSYKKRIQYQTYDVTSLIKEGKNVLGSILGNGWFKGYLTWEEKNNIYGDKLALILQLHIYYQDGSIDILKTDNSWKYNHGPIISSELYHGEVYDANFELVDWNIENYDDTNWKNAVVLNHSKSILVGQENIPAKKMQEIKPIKLIITPKNERVIDFGQNMVGFVRFKVKGNKGDKVILRHAEVLDKEGNFYLDNIRKAKQTIEYTLKGEEEEIFEPHFTYQGFRYVNVLEYPGEIDLDNFTGVVIYSGMQTTGEFECSDEDINRLQQNIVWSQKGNFVDVPTDCPQRDERLGWTGDAQVFIRTACFNMDVALFFKKWLNDLSADQLEEGGIPFVIPDAIGNNKTPTEWGEPHSAAAWGDAATICPWTIYNCYADERILESQYQSMKKWVEYIRHQGSNEFLWNTGFQFGDWLALDAKEGSYTGATPMDFIATAFYAYSTWILFNSAKVLGLEEDYNEYKRLYENIVREFRKEFVSPNGRLVSNTQTAHVLTLMFNLLEEKHINRNVEELVKLIETNNYHLTTGFVGTPYLCHVLTKYGRNDIALKLLLKKDCPSWLYQITKGATTIWEHWDGIKEDGSFWSADMNSFNHYAYGAIGEWMYNVIGGLNLIEPGYKKFSIKPYFEYFSCVKLRYKSLYGDIVVNWERNEKSISLKVKVPVNTQAEIILDNIKKETLKDIKIDEIIDIVQENSMYKILVGSGNYTFEFEK